MAIALGASIGIVSLDRRWHGPHSVPGIGTSKVGPPSTPVRARVVLLDQPTCRVVREAWTDDLAGEQELFPRVAAGTYFVAAFDATGEYNGVITTDVVIPAP